MTYPFRVNSTTPVFVLVHSSVNAILRNHIFENLLYVYLAMPYSSKLHSKENLMIEHMNLAGDFIYKR